MEIGEIDSMVGVDENKVDKFPKTKKIPRTLFVVLTVITGIAVLGIMGFYLINHRSGNQEIFCPSYDGNKQECSSHTECDWVSEAGDCNPAGEIGKADGIDKEFGDRGGLIQELEAIEVPDNPSNKLCKKIPLSDQSPYSERYYCLALVNHDERFCEGINEEKEKNICLAHAKADSSYCEKIQEESGKHVCYYMLAVSSKNPSFCSEIDYSLDEKEQCYMNYVTNLYAWNKSDEIKTEYCDELGTPDKYTCRALKERDVSLCGDNLHCLTFFKQDISFCEGNESVLKDCVRDRAMANKDVSICEKLSGEKRDDCIGDFCTHIKLDVNICNTIKDIEARQDRYLELAMNLANW